ncbi:reverse transcriptase domain-containing protein, partial [Clostridioides difficile]
MDRITAKKFRENLDENINIIRKKVNNRTYTFTRYRQLLVSKGKNKNPRCICIPTIRDKLVLSILNEILFGVYGQKGQTQMPQVIISEIVNELRNYKYFIKLDIKTFYASIDHEILMKKLNQRIHKKEIRNLIEKSIKTPEIAIPIK